MVLDLIDELESIDPRSWGYILFVNWYKNVSLKESIDLHSSGFFILAAWDHYWGLGKGFKGTVLCLYVVLTVLEEESVLALRSP
jgi:hypothetical protein